MALFLIVIEYPLILIGHKIEPTNLAGPGWDTPIFLLSIIYNLVMIRIGIRNWNKGIIPKLYVVISILSFILIGYRGTKPHW
jgi:hypothetical protein